MRKTIISLITAVTVLLGSMSVVMADRVSTTSDSAKWTVFVYLCGSDLESYYGCASGDLYEMIDAQTGDDVRFVVETGGAASWESEVDPNYNERYLVQNGIATLVDQQPRSSMGDSATLADFLNWGVQNYPADHMALIFWNHGSGSINGVCFDENEYYDSLSLREIDAALMSVSIPGGKLDFIGFDACLMATIETASILAPYAEYMIASEEIEPGSGWDYVSLGNYLGSNPNVDALTLGYEICDSYFESAGAEDATLTLADLSKVAAFKTAYDIFTENLYNAGYDEATLAEIVRGITDADNFGGNNASEGYTNMVDLGGIIEAGSPYALGGDAALAALADIVVYNVNGSLHAYASGLATYYPLSIQGSSEMQTFETVCVSPYYLSFIDRQGYGSVNDGDISDYDEHQWTSDEYEEFNYEDSYVIDDDTGYYTYDDTAVYDDGYWDYIDDYQVTGQSPLITFSQQPTLDTNGVYSFILDDSGYNYTESVEGVVYEIYDDAYVSLGSTYDVVANWTTGRFSDGFDGYWLSLPDGQNLCIYEVKNIDGYTVYTAPVRVNGEVAYLRMVEDAQGNISVKGYWDGVSYFGSSDRDVIPLVPGDVIKPLYDWWDPSIGDWGEGYYAGSEYTVTDNFYVQDALMEPCPYMFAFCINDIFGDYYLTDYVVFEVDAAGNLYYHDDYDFSSYDNTDTFDYDEGYELSYEAGYWYFDEPFNYQGYDNYWDYYYSTDYDFLSDPYYDYYHYYDYDYSSYDYSSYDNNDYSDYDYDNSHDQ